MRELTEEQKKQMDDVFNEPLSDRKKNVPADYKPPLKGKDESIEDYFARLDAYDAEYYKKKV